MTLSWLNKLSIILACCYYITACDNFGKYASNSPSDSGQKPHSPGNDINQPSIDNSTWVVLKGSLLDQTGAAVDDANVTIAEFTVKTDVNGNFMFRQLLRENVLLTVFTPDHRTEYLPVYLSQSESVKTITLDPIVLTKRLPGHVRMLFGGDVAFGRRFLDPDNLTPRDQVPNDHPEALIKASDPEPGTRKVLEAIRPWYQEADYGIFNFETPVTDNPVTPHQEKAFAFFTLPGSVPALNWLGIDYVSLGNNHTYDYLEQGLIDTLFHLDNNQLGYSGAGLDITDAFKAHRATVGESTYGFLSMNSITGSVHPESYVADVTKGGAANLNRTNDVIASIKREVDDGIIPILQYHMGNEYVFEPSNFSLNRMQIAADNGSPLVISHHPHVAQGVGIIGDTVNVLGLGNLAFDQARLETMMGVLARVDFDGAHVEQLRMLPVYLENFAPVPVSGRLASSFIRRLSEFSHDYGGFIYPYHGQGWVALNDSMPIQLENSVTIDISISDSGSTIIDLRNWAHDDESLLEINTDSNLTIHMGRDIFGHGDFEDWDIDQDQQEAKRWDVSGDSRFICQDNVFKGTNALCSTRTSRNRSDSVTANRNRIRVMGDALDIPNKDLSIFGYIKGNNAGAITIQTRYFASFGGMKFGQENAFLHPGGTFNWQPFSAVLNMPDEVPAEQGQLPEAINARAVRMFIRHSPPVDNEALLMIDEVAFINWENEIEPNTLLRVPHAKDFLRITGSQGVHRLTLTFARHLPSVVTDSGKLPNRN